MAVPLTGRALLDPGDPSLGYNGKDAIAVPDSTYSVVITSYTDKAGKKATPSTMPKAIEAAGTYEFKIAPAEGNVNFTFDATEYTMIVTDQNVSPDVPAAKWLADEVYKFAVPAMEWAIGEGLFGVDTDYLNPGADITRAELAAVLVRYLGL